MTRPILFDTDPGHDDALAWMLAHASPELEVLGVTLTYGNTALERTWRNAQVIRDVLGANVPIIAGASEPLIRDRIHAEGAHGPSGMEGPPLPDASPVREPRRAAQFMIERILERPGEVTLVPVGPLTNVALAMRLEPRIVPLIREIALMGGSTDRGNFTPSAEFNILCDPHAARVVFESGAPIAMFGLNVTEGVMLERQDLERVRAWPTRAGRLLAALLEFSIGKHEGWGFTGACMHDPCPIAYLTHPECFTLEPMFVEVDTHPGPNFARTTCDTRGALGRAPNARVAVATRSRAVPELLLERLASLD